MGCDIHMYIEYNEKNNENKSWISFSKKINPGRLYAIFAKLADVCNHKEWNIKPIAADRGFPENAGCYSVSDNYIDVSDNYMCLSDEEVDNNSCSKEMAESWVKWGYSKYINNEKNKVSNPDWHSHSWATTKELKKVLKFINVKRGNIPEWFAVLDTMKSLEKSGKDVRVVFWFDK